MGEKNLVILSGLVKQAIHDHLLHRHAGHVAGVGRQRIDPPRPVVEVLDDASLFELICAPVCRFELLPDVCKVLHDIRLIQLTRHDAKGAQLQEAYERVRPHLGILERATLGEEVMHDVQAIAQPLIFIQIAL